MAAEETNNNLSDNELYQTAEDYLPKLAGGLMAIAELMRNGNEADGAFFFTKAAGWVALAGGILKKHKII